MARKQPRYRTLEAQAWFVAAEALQQAHSSLLVSCAAKRPIPRRLRRMEEARVVLSHVVPELYRRAESIDLYAQSEATL